MLREIRTRLSVFVALTVVAACGDASTTAPERGVVVTAEVQAGAIVAGDTARFEVWVTRRADVTGPVTLDVSGLPAGVTARFSPAVLNGGASSTFLTLTASDSAIAMTSSLTVSVKGATSIAATITLRVVNPLAPHPIKKTPPTASNWYDKLTRKKGK
jgi:hypothetical protein